MTDCLETLHIILRNPVELVKAQADIDATWRAAMSRQPRPARERLIVTGAAASRVRCPTAKRVILTTESDWSK